MDKSLRKRMNYVKLIFLFLDVGANVMVTAFRSLYEGKRPPEKYLIDLAKEKKNNLYDVEKETLQRLKNGQMTLDQVDITLMYKLMQLTCGLERKSGKKNSVWSKNCPKEKRKCVEHLLYRYKELRNKLIHDFTGLQFLSDSSFSRIEEKNEKLLNTIIIEVGIRAELKENEIIEWQRKLRDDLSRICDWSVGPIESDRDDDVSQVVQQQEGGAVRAFQRMFRFQQRDQMQQQQQRRNPSEIVTEQILDRYQNQLDNGTSMSQQLQSQASSRKPLYSRRDRRYWVDQLVSTDVLKNKKSMKSFMSGIDTFLLCQTIFVFG